MNGEAIRVGNKMYQVTPIRLHSIKLLFFFFLVSVLFLFVCCCFFLFLFCFFFFFFFFFLGGGGVNWSCLDWFEKFQLLNVFRSQDVVKRFKKRSFFLNVTCAFSAVAFLSSNILQASRVTEYHCESFLFRNFIEKVFLQ